MRPRTAPRVIEAQLKRFIPREYLEEAETRERAIKIARPTTEKYRRRIEREVLKLLKESLTERQIQERLTEKYGRR